MNRTTIMLPLALKSKALRFATAAHISLAQLIRQILEEKLNQKSHVMPDPLFDQVHFFEGKVPKDLSENHNEYLYSEK